MFNEIRILYIHNILLIIIGYYTYKYTEFRKTRRPLMYYFTFAQYTLILTSKYTNFIILLLLYRNCYYNIAAVNNLGRIVLYVRTHYNIL